MEPMRERLERLRRLVHQNPSEALWRSLCAVLQRWPEQDRVVAVDYVNDNLAAWPDAMRLAPKSWLKASAKGQSAELLKVARAISFSAGLRASIRDLTHDPRLTQITTLLAPGYKLTSADVAALSSPQARFKLNTLHLAHTEVNASSLREMLVAGGALGELKDLKLASCGLGAEVNTVLSEPSSLPDLQTLSVPQNALTADDLSAIVQAHPRLKGLDVSGNALGAGGLQALLMGGALESLAAARCGLEGDVDALVDQGGALRELDLSSNALQLEALGEASWWGALTSLRLANTGLKTNGLKALFEGWDQLQWQTLDLTSNKLSLAGISLLAQSRALGQLQVLELGACGLKTPALMALLNHKGLHKLHTLDLRRNTFDLEGAKALASIPAFRRLKTLKLDRDNVPWKAYPLLAQSVHLPAKFCAQWGR